MVNYRDAVLLVAAVFTLCLLGHMVTSCNEQVCASMVSKCMLTASCKCDLKDCSCCKECYNCLSYLYSECCSCVDMCPKPNVTKMGLSKRSYVEDLDSVPGLFAALTEGGDDPEWSTMTFPVDFDSALYGAKFDYDLKMTSHSEQTLEQSVKTVDKVVTYNCTVVFMSQCLSSSKCKNNCQSMGANSFRWFHDGCCECVGSMCLNYGVNESRCLACPETRDEDLEPPPNEDDLDYGEGHGALEGGDSNI